ncbi:hypothetical protein [Rickettsiella endosymbiont of Miltochrista miniata]|uniref:hypothetical protein n=1 Tax=Rickettsiella endosymbiont of Miltochrista miniata TaxID=3066239 RepID=UPI00313CD175
MPAIIKKAAGKQLEKVLQDVLNTEPNEWKYFFEPHRIKEVLEKLANQIKSNNFFTKDYSINTFLDFLKAYVKSEFTIDKLKTIDNDILQNLNKIFRDSKDIIIAQSFFNEAQIIIVTNYLSFFKLFLEWNNRDLLENNRINLHADDLKQVAIKVVENNNGTTHDFVATYISTLKLSFDSMIFLQDYQNANQGVVSIAKSLFLQKDININLVITQFFGFFAYESTLIEYYKNKLSLSDVQPWQENIILAATDLQQYFFDHIDSRDDISKQALKYYFFKYFLEEANILSPLKDRYASYLSYYSDKNFNPLPYIYECPTLGLNKFLIQHAGLDKNKLEIVCQAKACADGNYDQWLKRTGISQNLPVVSHYTCYIFSNESSYESDIYRFVNFEPMSTAFFIGALRNATHAIGKAYVQYRSDPSSWWVVSAHEYNHFINFIKFGYIPRSFDEGLSYRLILDVCFDAGFQFWLRENRNNYTSLDLLSSQEFIGYNPSSLFMSYFVDTNPPGFAKILESYQKRDSSIPLQITHLIQQDKGYLPWLDSYQKHCFNHTFRALGAGDNYCPDLLQANLMKKKYTENLSTGKTSMPTVFRKNHHSLMYPTTSMHRNPKSTLGFLAKKPSADEMGRKLIFAISNDNLVEFKQLLREGANPNYYEDGKTILHFLYFYGKCDTQYLESLLIHGAKISNKEDLLHYAMGEKHCNATQLEAIKSIFGKFTPAKLEETGLIPYQQKKLTITISIPISAFVSGVIAGGWEEVTKRNSGQYPCLPNIIFYGLEPASLAMGSAAMNSLLVGSATFIGLEDAWLSFAYYLGMNYLGLMLAQLGEKATKKIQNKLLNILMPILLYTFFINPSLLITLLNEGFGIEILQAVMMPLFSILSSGILFKAGEYGTQKAIGKFFPVNSALTDTNKSYIRYEMGDINEESKEESIWDEKLGNFKNNYANLKVLFVPLLKTSAHKLIFSKNLNLLEKFSEVETIKQIDNNPDDFKKAFSALERIKEDLSNLDKAPNKKNILAEITNNLMPTMNAIRPSQQVINARGGLAQNKGVVTIVEEQRAPLMASFTKEAPRYTRTPTSKLTGISSIFKPTDFPAPHTEQELREMERDMNSKCYPA